MPVISRTRIRPLGLLTALAALVILALLVRHAFVGFFDHDEVEHLHAAWLVAQGDRPFVDFFEAHQPSLWYLLAPLTTAFAPDNLVTGGRLLMLLFALATLAAVFRTARAISGSAPAGAFATLLLPATWVFARTVMEVRPDVPQICFLAWSMERFVAWSRHPRWQPALACGLAGGIAIAFLHKAVVLLPGLALGALLAFAARPRMPTRTLLASLGAALAGLTLPVAAMYGAMWAAGMLPAYRFLALRFMAAIQTGTRLELHFSPLSSLASVFVNSPGLFLAGIPGLLLGLRRLRDPAVAAVLATLVATLALVATSRMPFKQFFLPVWTSLAILASLFLARLETMRGQGPARLVAHVPAVLVIVSLGLGAAGLWVSPTNRVHKAVAARLVALTAPDEPVFAQPPWHPIARRDAGFLWFDVREFLAALDAMAPLEGPVANEIARRMRDVVSNPPAAVFLSSPALRSVGPLDAYVSAHLREDDLMRGMYVR